MTTSAPTSLILPRLRAAAVCLPFLVALAWPGAAAAAPSVYVFPIPNARFAAPQTQITFRGLGVSRLGPMTVSGSRTGIHPGRLLSDSDGAGGSFVPNSAFAPGETVSVSTRLNIVAGTNGSFHFRIASPARPNRGNPFPPASRVRGDVRRFHSRPDLAPVSIRVNRRHGGTARGEIFVGPEVGPIQDGPMILDSRGRLVWFKPLPHKQFATDFRVQRYHGRSVLTWWQGKVAVGIGVGQGIIADSSYREFAAVHAGNGLAADLHEFQLTHAGTALITSYFPVYTDARSVHAGRHRVVEDSVVQEIDIPTGLVLFQWDSLDHVPFVGSHAPIKTPYNYFHVNSVQEDYDRNFVISGRNTWSAYKVNRHTAQTMWILGGRYSSFKMGRGTQFAYAHDARVRSRGDRLVTVFDDGGSPFVHNSRGVTLRLDFRHKRATRAHSYGHSPSLQSQFEGNMQQLSNHNVFIGWGQPPNFSEFNSRGSMLFDAQFYGANSSYRAWRMRWSGRPPTSPAVAASNRGSGTTVWVSWNGATDVYRWRVLGGSRASALHSLGSVSKGGFETGISVRRQQYVAVQGLDFRGRVLGQSVAVRVR
jgi:arylsulfotransferase ASST